ncbi:uncharacterized protein LOC117109601 [Anneissia japonica]|uniref:uncharacterized protein LOC117109601 n=1 Tax=Anneissia japonica TaxID=1529436 RepID=UPI0014257BA7|nr:uncharacterized protein LOC117109601 [Anneissia japonica]
MRKPMKIILSIIYVVVLTSTSVTANNETSTEPTDVGKTESSFTPETVAALWAGFFGGLVGVFGIGMLFYQLRIRKYEEYKRRNDEIAVMPPVGVTFPNSLGCCGR